MEACMRVSKPCVKPWDLGVVAPELAKHLGDALCLDAAGQECIQSLAARRNLHDFLVPLQVPALVDTEPESTGDHASTIAPLQIIAKPSTLTGHIPTHRSLLARIHNARFAFTIIHNYFPHEGHRLSWQPTNTLFEGIQADIRFQASAHGGWGLIQVSEFTIWP